MSGQLNNEWQSNEYFECTHKQPMMWNKAIIKHHTILLGNVAWETKIFLRARRPIMVIVGDIACGYDPPNMGRVTVKAIHPLRLVGPLSGRFEVTGRLWFVEGLWFRRMAT